LLSLLLLIGTLGMWIRSQWAPGDRIIPRVTDEDGVLHYRAIILVNGRRGMRGLYLRQSYGHLDPQRKAELVRFLTDRSHADEVFLELLLESDLDRQTSGHLNFIDRWGFTLQKYQYQR